MLLFPSLPFSEHFVSTPPTAVSAFKPNLNHTTVMQENKQTKKQPTLQIPLHKETRISEQTLLFRKHHQLCQNVKHLWKEKIQMQSAQKKQSTAAEPTVVPASTAPALQMPEMVLLSCKLRRDVSHQSPSQPIPAHGRCAGCAWDLPVR